MVGIGLAVKYSITRVARPPKVTLELRGRAKDVTFIVA